MKPVLRYIEHKLKNKKLGRPGNKPNLFVVHLAVLCSDYHQIKYHQNMFSVQVNDLKSSAIIEIYERKLEAMAVSWLIILYIVESTIYDRIT